MSSGIRKRTYRAGDNMSTGEGDHLTDNSPDYSGTYDDKEKIKYKSGHHVCKKALRKILIFFFFLVLLPSSLAFLVLTLVYYYVPCPIDPQLYSLPDPPAFTGPLAPNNLLTKAEHILPRQVLGPESIVLDGDKIYTGTYDGNIVQIANRKIQRYVKLVDRKEPCGSFEREPICGRPLGMRMNEENELVVADAYLGIYKVNIWTNTSTQIVAGGEIVDGRPLKFINDLAVLPDGRIFFTDSSSTWDRRSHIYIFLEAKPDGRLLMYNPATNTVHVLVEGLYFANGVELSLDKKSLFITETSMARIHRYHLDGERMGQIELFAQNLPGYPDNIRLSSNGNLWVPMVSRIRRNESFSWYDYVADKPWIRRLFSQIVPVKYMHSLIDVIIPKYGLIVQLDQNGRIVKSLHDPTGKVISSVSQVADAGKVLFLGSYCSSYIGKVQL